MKKMTITLILTKLLLRPKTCGGVKAFVLVALAAEKDDAGKQNAVSAMAGKKAEIVALAGEIGETIMKDIVLKDLLGEE